MAMEWNFDELENLNLSLCFCSDFSYYVVMNLQFREDWHTHLNVCLDRILGGKGTSNFTSLFTILWDYVLMNMSAMMSLFLGWTFLHNKFTNHEIL